MPYARLPNPCDVVPGWQLDFGALNNLILPLRHRIPSVIPYYERINQCYKKMEDIGKRLGQDYNRALDALLQSHVTKMDLDDALTQPATSQHEIARLQKIYSEAQATYQDWICEALQFETFISGENGRAFVKLTDDFVKLVLPLTISVANGGLDDQSVECSIAAQDQAFRDRKKQQEKALKHAPGEQKCQKVINLDHTRMAPPFHKRLSIITPLRGNITCTSWVSILIPSPSNPSILLVNHQLGIPDRLGYPNPTVNS